MPVIRVTDVTWKRLERHARGFDTPERVIVRALDALEANRVDAIPQNSPELDAKPKHTRERVLGTKGQRRDKYRTPLMETIYELGGTANLDRIRALLAKRLASQLDESDHKTVASTDEPRWWNDVKWARDDLVKEGLFRRDSKRGVWALTAAGEKEVETRRA